MASPRSVTKFVAERLKLTVLVRHCAKGRGWRDATHLSALGLKRTLSHSIRKVSLLRPGQKQSEQLGPALAVDDPVDEVGPEAPLERDHGFLLVGDVIAEALESE